MSKLKIRETIRKKFKGLWHDRKISSINKKNKLYHVKYNNNDSEDMIMAEVRKYWVKPEPEEDKSSSKKKQRTKEHYKITKIAKNKSSLLAIYYRCTIKQSNMMYVATFFVIVGLLLREIDMP